MPRLHLADTGLRTLGEAAVEHEEDNPYDRLLDVVSQFGPAPPEHIAVRPGVPLGSAGSAPPQSQDQQPEQEYSVGPVPHDTSLEQGPNPFDQLLQSQNPFDRLVAAHPPVSPTKETEKAVAAPSTGIRFATGEEYAAKLRGPIEEAKAAIAGVQQGIEGFKQTPTGKMLTKPSPAWMQPVESAIRDWHPPVEANPMYWYAKGVEKAAGHLPAGKYKEALKFEAGALQGTAGLVSESGTLPNIALSLTGEGEALMVKGGLEAAKAAKVTKTLSNVVSGTFLGQGLVGTPQQWNALRAAYQSGDSG